MILFCMQQPIHIRASSNIHNQDRRIQIPAILRRQPSLKHANFIFIPFSGIRSICSCLPQLPKYLHFQGKLLPVRYWVKFINHFTKKNRIIANYHRKRSSMKNNVFFEHKQILYLLFQTSIDGGNLARSLFRTVHVHRNMMKTKKVSKP